jgi:hypothetical protein
MPQALTLAPSLKTERDATSRVRAKFESFNSTIWEHLMSMFGNFQSTKSIDSSAKGKESTPTSNIRGDNPVHEPEQDTLGRTEFAVKFVRDILALDRSEGLVVGVLGPWGTGKTSFINLVRWELDRKHIAIVDFNPWMFSGAPQLVDSFFFELAAQLKIRKDLAQIGENIEHYGEIFSGMGWIPVVGPWLESGKVATKILGKILQRKREGVSGPRRKIEEALQKYNKPIVVVLDDLDRLSSGEIRDIFKLIRLTANFPNVMYLVAFDRVRIESALAEDGIPGREYLEKIVQFTIDLPTIPHSVLNRQIFDALDIILKNLEIQPKLDTGEWSRIFPEVIRPLVRTMRDVRRYAAAVGPVVASLGGQVALVDLLALEAVRVFLPGVFVQLPGAAAGLTSTANFGRFIPQPRSIMKAQVDSFIAAAPGGKEDVVLALVQHLFPHAVRDSKGDFFDQPPPDVKSLRDRRVASQDILRLYLERQVSSESLLAFLNTERAYAILGDLEKLDDFLRSLDPDQLQDVIAGLEAFEGQFQADQVVPGLIVLLNLIPLMPRRHGGIFDYPAYLAVGRVAYRLLRIIKEPRDVEAAACEILPRLSWLSSKLELIRLIGHREKIGTKLVSETMADILECSWRAEVRSASVEQLLSEWDLGRVLIFTNREAQDNESAWHPTDSPAMTHAILRSFRIWSEDRFVGFSWNSLLEIYGDESRLREQVELMKAADLKDTEGLLEMAESYLTGWRPRELVDE